MFTLELICRAQHRIRGFVHRTPLIPSATLSAHLGARVSLKLECLQKTGSFKPRGAFNKMLSLSPEERQRGIVAVSGGNHAQGAAYAARQLGIDATIVMPASTPRNYVEATRGYGAEIVLTPDIRAAFAEMYRLRDQGRTLVHPFDDPLVAAGQGTIGLEILEDLPNVDRVYVSIGGGALITGVAKALRSLRPEVRVIGVETRGADAMSQSLHANELVELPAITSIARTLGAPKVSDFTLSHVRELVEEVKVVEDAAAARALFLILERTKYLVEPAAACCLAAAEQQRGQFRADEQIVLVLCGGNVSTEDLATYWQRFGAVAT
ncbi:MAG: pyridoxal-phosphate dependent enzyme [Gemmataceae bacterium]|nr:pyridoxal-phosphate dependent enzyme [Gemmataceae bacterium]